MGYLSESTIRRLTLAGVLATSLVGLTGCGLRLSGLLTPLYKTPSGYSETYQDHLEAADGGPIRKELVDPTLATIHDWMQPVPLPKVQTTQDPDSMRDNGQGLMPDGNVPVIPDFGPGLRPGEAPDLLPGTAPGTVVPPIPRGNSGGAAPAPGV